MNQIKLFLSRIWAIKWWLFLALVVAVIDQWSKQVVSSELVYGQPIRILSFLNFHLAHNYGAAFSFLENAAFGGLLLLAISVLFSVLIGLFWMPVQKRGFVLFGMSMVLGGAVGNLVDRAALGYVVDFISLYYQGYYFAIFNLADSAITLGAVVLGIEWLILEPKRNRKVAD